jgi:glucokinase
MNSDQQIAAIGIDVGGTKIAAGVVWWPSAEVVFSCTVPTMPERGGEAILATVTQVLRSLLVEARTHTIPIRAAGVGVAELVDADGNVTSGHTIPWSNLQVRERLSELCPVQLESDVRAAALAEAMFGAGRHLNTFVYISVGTGISSCFVQEGRPWHGARGNALVMASSPLSTVCTACGEQLHPVLEEFASGPAIATRYRASLTASVARLQTPNAEQVFQAAAEGDTLAAEILRSAGTALGVSVAFLVNVLDPEAVVIGGGLGLAQGVYWESFVKSAREHIWSPCTRTLPVLRAALGVHSGVIGAAAKVFAANSFKEESQWV